MKDKCFLINLLLIILGGLLVAIWIYLDYERWIHEPLALQPRFKQASRQQLRKAMHYHGILFAQQDDKGEWYFVRDGERCKLFKERR